jgi:hypothetical protein
MANAGCQHCAVHAIDPGLSPLNTLNYYASVLDKMGAEQPTGCVCSRCREFRLLVTALGRQVRPADLPWMPLMRSD